MFRNKLRIAAAVFMLGFFAGVSTLYADSKTDYSYGTVNGINYTGRTFGEWDYSGGGWGLYGNGSTYTSGSTNVDQIAADSFGYEWCDFIIIDEEWSNQDTEQNHWYAYASGSGWAMAGTCFGEVHQFSTDTNHPVWDDPDFDQVQSGVTFILPN